ncbi:hypothetical protein EBO34_18355 [Alteribacter keqinensis]|uniref:Uncharacterized protein n=1 Tax=Alteribacter keqinensis TaxID=2483800 RepID=A0A3M7TNN4_9BACI|nr:hypothetical protein EBO34_18355 [Alteribacter keqinensis]
MGVEANLFKVGVNLFKVGANLFKCMLNPFKCTLNLFKGETNQGFWYFKSIERRSKTAFSRAEELISNIKNATKGEQPLVAVITIPNQ